MGMKSKKISFVNIKNALSRAEMRTIMAGSSGQWCGFCHNPSAPPGAGCFTMAEYGGSCRCEYNPMYYPCP